MTKPVRVEADASANGAAAQDEERPGGAPRLDPAKSIRVRGAREHNLKGVDVDIPRDRLVVITGLSGSGKSSLAFDTIFAEGQRKYMESLSAYARQFLDQLKKPDVEDIQGLPPTIAIEQRSSGHNPRSTVATSTEIYDYLRLLFARVGQPTCWHPTKVRKDGAVLERCGRPISATPASQIVEAVIALADPAGTKMTVLAPVVRQKKGFHRDVMEELQKAGWSRVRVNGQVKDLREVLKDSGDNPLGLGRYEKHDLDAVIDRVVLKPADADGRQRLAESIESALKLAAGTVIISTEGEGGKGYDRVYSDKHACAEHPECSLSELEPRIFSFNSPFGACPSCDGIGSKMELDELLVMPNEELSFKGGAIAAYAKNMAVRAWFSRGLKKFARAMSFGYDDPVKELTAEQRRMLLHGTTADDAARHKFKFKGVIPELTEWWGSTQNETVKEFLGQFMSQTPCLSCHGDRLRVESLSVLINTAGALPAETVAERTLHGLTADKHRVNIADYAKLNIAEAVKVIDGLRLTKEQASIAEPIIKEVRARLGFLASVGLQYLSLDRKTATLSGGEAQRIRLATQVGSGLVGACYVLDEPTIGLHQRDNDRLIGTLRHLTDIGNTVLVVEHDEDMIRMSDYVLDIGPGPGVHGGQVVAQGTAAEIGRHPTSLTGKYLSGRLKIEGPAKRRALSEKKAVCIKGARQNNLKSVDAAFPLGGFVCVTGVSGSGKSTLVNEILLPAVKKEVFGSRLKPGLHTRITGAKQIDRVVEVDQSPIGRTPRSNPATYTGFFDDVRKAFALTKEAKVRGYEPGRFSFNVKGGRCESCQGQGTKKIEMHFLPDVFVECEVCRGKRYNRETLEVLYRGKNIADVLDMTVEEGCRFFENHPKIARYLQCLHDVGLDYVKLGQPSTQLSGGEAQRVKLATELAGGDASAGGAGVGSVGGHTLYVLDEPTTGLHFEDIRKLVAVLQRLVDAGNTLVVIEHNLDVIKCADWIIDLGPEGGAGGGTIVASGTPEQVAATPASYTGQYLKPLLAK
ncbi:MAG TPA: excinuclease ABC subunit UvrA [Phycisphaerales bacterium]|nr:excinuclease ABC subunit UvrA [Phycisphaerales bacterium]